MCTTVSVCVPRLTMYIHYLTYIFRNIPRTCRIRDVHAWAPHSAVLRLVIPSRASPITLVPQRGRARAFELRVPTPPQDTRFTGPAPIIRRSRDGRWLPTALLLASFIISECADPSDYYQAEVGSALAISLYPSPLASNLPR